MISSIENQYMKEIAKALVDKNASIMVGAGFSKNARYNGSDDNRMLDWNRLADKFYNILYKDNSKYKKEYLNPIALAEEVEIMYGRKKLHDIIRESLPDLEHSPADIHYSILELSWKDIFTTNYDTLLERASKEVINRDYLVINNKEDLVHSAKDSRIIKLHGSFPSNIPFIITEEDYRKYPKNFGPYVNTVQQALIENTFCMIGFSGNDPNFLSWIGWLSDNYSNVIPQQIYLISVGGENEVQKAKLKSKNIMVLDLKKMWPNLNYENRIMSFLSNINSILEKEKDKIQWININDLKELDKISNDNNINKLDGETLRKYTGFIKEKIKSYPGWIAMPTKYKNISAHMLGKMVDILFRIKRLDIENSIKIDFIYEYLKFKDISNRPIFKEEIPIIEEIIKNVAYDERKINLIKLMLLRSYREFGLREEFDKLIMNIDRNILGDYYTNFLRYEECMMELHSLNLLAFSEKVLKWDVDSYDYYWTLIKISLLVKLEDYEICEEIAKNTLYNLRKIRYKKLDLEFIRNQSIEDCLVKLTNHIKQAINPFYTEESEYEEAMIKNNLIGENSFEWIKENKTYVSSFRFEYRGESIKKTKLLFDLDSKMKRHSFKSENKVLIESLEYLRFREVTGTPFLIGNVTSKEGIVELIRRILDYNPSLALITLIKSNENKGLGHIYNRRILNNISMDEADFKCKRSLDLINDFLLEEINKNNWFHAKNIYDYTAGLIPEIVSKLITKCSLEIRDEVLDTCLNIYSSDKIKSFKKVNVLIRRLINSYSKSELIERISLFLKFPFINEQREREYPDPISYVEVEWNFKKIKLASDAYKDIISQLFIYEDKYKMENLIRIIIVYFIFEFNESEENKLENLIWSNYDGSNLPEINGINKYILMELPYSEYISLDELKAKLVDEAIEELENECTEGNNGIIISGSNNIAFNMVERVISDSILDVDKLEYVIELLLKLILKYKKELESYGLFNIFNYKNETRLKIKKCGILIRNILYYYPTVNHTKNTLDNIQQIIKTLSELDIYIPSLTILYELVVNKNTDIIPIVRETALYNREDEFIDLMFTLSLIISGKNIEIKKDIKINWLKIILERICITNDSYQSIKKLTEIVESLSDEDFNIISSYIIILIEKSLGYTKIGEYDSREDVIKKLTYKKEISRFTNMLYKRNLKENERLNKLVMKWKDICENKNEFVEIRKYWN